ncbi:isocitrate lyase/PEP mutase family protein [Streptomyces sp. BI20]|uniref:isocitrate lyase/PEP mutase family protein n=1 Tax=Streptomyces sp. BI20 TaxID=3403460 RepID=UPI003C748F33
MAFSGGFSGGVREKGERFRGLHEGPGVFVVANPWDAGSARMLAGLGYAALATTGAGLAYASGRPDGAVTRAEVLENARVIAGAVDVPVTVDLESGFGVDPAGVAETVRAVAGAGAVGASVEDSTGDPADPVRPLGEAVARVAAAVEAARGLGFPFTVTARAENFFVGRPDLPDTLRRLRAYAEVGADVVFAPGLPDEAAVRAVCAATDRPVNVLASPAFTVAGLGALGVRRVSLGSGLARVAHSALLAAAGEVLAEGTFGAVAAARSYAEMNALLKGV